MRFPPTSSWYCRWLRHTQEIDILVRETHPDAPSFLVGPKMYQSLRKRERETEKKERLSKDSPTFVPELGMEISLVSFS